MQDVIISGARGRMGSTLVSMAQRDQELNLKGVLEQESKISELDHLACLKDSDPQSLLPQVPNGVVIDFTEPKATLELIKAAVHNKNPMVIGTTGFKEEQQKELEEASQALPMFWAPNMSVGINVLLQILPKLAQYLGPDYDLELSEIHHKHKKDAPSGTAIKLAQVLKETRGWTDDDPLRYCRQGIIGERKQKEIGVQTLRGGDVIGEHTVYFLGPNERIDVTHRAHSRETFVQGALRAAKWIGQKKPGKLYSMVDLFLDT